MRKFAGLLIVVSSFFSAAAIAGGDDVPPRVVGLLTGGMFANNCVYPEDEYVPLYVYAEPYLEWYSFVAQKAVKTPVLGKIVIKGIAGKPGTENSQDCYSGKVNAVLIQDKSPDQPLSPVVDGDGETRGLFVYGTSSNGEGFSQYKWLKIKVGSQWGWVGLGDPYQYLDYAAQASVPSDYSVVCLSLGQCSAPSAALLRDITNAQQNGVQEQYSPYQVVSVDSDGITRYFRLKRDPGLPIATKKKLPAELWIPVYNAKTGTMTAVRGGC